MKGFYYESEEMKIMKRLKRLLSVLFVWLCVAFCCSMYALAAENDVIKNDQNGIPDKVLYREILKELGKKKNQTFTEKEARSIQELKILDKKAGIKTLKGIGYLEKLETLIIGKCKLKNLNGVEKLPNLESLVVPDNQRKDVRVMKNAKNLRGLWIDHNKLSSLEGLESLNNLTTLDAGNNKIRSLNAIRKLEKLKYLDVNHNRLTNLNGTEKLKNLKVLYVGSNRLKNIKAIKNLRKIKSLDISYNQLKNLEGLRCISSLGNLDASHNKLTRLPDMRKNKELAINSCSIIFNRLDEAEIRHKMPSKFFRKGGKRETWLKNQLYYQNVKDSIQIIFPADGKIRKDTTKIVGKAHRDANIRLINQSKNTFIEARTDENGNFTMDKVDLSAWVGDTVHFGYTDYDLSEKIQLPSFVIIQ